MTIDPSLRALVRTLEEKDVEAKLIFVVGSAFIAGKAVSLAKYKAALDDPKRKTSGGANTVPSDRPDDDLADGFIHLVEISVRTGVTNVQYNRGALRLNLEHVAGFMIGWPEDDKAQPPKSE